MEMSSTPWIPKNTSTNQSARKVRSDCWKAFLGTLWHSRGVGGYFHFFPQSHHPNRQIISYWCTLSTVICRKSLLESPNCVCWHCGFFESVLKLRKRSLKKCILSQNGQTRVRERVICTYEGEICNRITRISLKIWNSDVLWGFSPVLCKSTVSPWLIQFSLCKMWSQSLENAILWWSYQWSNFKCYSTCMIH